MKENVFSTAVGGIIWLILLTVMGWASVPERVEYRPYLAYPEKSQLLRYTAEQMAAETARYNWYIEAQEARGMANAR